MRSGSRRPGAGDAQGSGRLPHVRDHGGRLRAALPAGPGPGRAAATPARGGQGGAAGPARRGGAGAAADAARGRRVRRADGLHRTPARQAARGRSTRATEELMNPEALSVLIPIVAIGGGWGSGGGRGGGVMAEGAGGGGGRGGGGGGGGAGEDPQRAAALEAQVAALQGQISELAERLDFAERLLAEQRGRKLGAGQ